MPGVSPLGGGVPGYGVFTVPYSYTYLTLTHYFCTSDHCIYSSNWSWGLYLVTGGITWSWGVYFVSGGWVYLVPGCVPGPRGLSDLGGMFALGECLLLGGCMLLGGVCIPACTEADPLLDRKTDTCQSITLAQIRCGR